MNVLFRRVPTQRIGRRCFSSGSNDSKLVLVNQEDGIATITLNAPDKMNPLTVDMGVQFREEVNRLQENASGIRAVILTGAGTIMARTSYPAFVEFSDKFSKRPAGKAFSAGGDLQFLDDRYGRRNLADAVAVQTLSYVFQDEGLSLS